jgi:hypothetical protein
MCRRLQRVELHLRVGDVPFVNSAVMRIAVSNAISSDRAVEQGLIEIEG